MPLPFVKVKVDNDDSDDMLDVEVYVSRKGVPLPEVPTAALAVPPRLTVEENLEPNPETQKREVRCIDKSAPHLPNSPSPKTFSNPPPEFIKRILT